MEKMMMPAYYNILSTEEMTYTEGGSSYDDAAASFAVSYLIGYGAGLALSLGNMVWGIGKTRNWIKEEKSKGATTSELMSRGVDAAFDYMNKSIWNAVVGVYTTVNLVGWWPVTAIAWVTA